MRAKNIARIIIGVLVIIFLVVYISMATGYVEVEAGRKTTLTNEAMRKYEADLKMGKKIDVKDYIEEEKIYSNNISNMTLGATSIIEKGFNGIMNYLFKEVDKAVNSK